jgi:hypothetical protein
MTPSTALLADCSRSRIKPKGLLPLHSGYLLRNSSGPLWDPYLSVANLGGSSSTRRWELKQPSLHIPLQWHLGLATTERM